MCKIDLSLYGCETWFLLLWEEPIVEGFWEQNVEENMMTPHTVLLNL